MGRSISESTAKTLERNERNGDLCRSGGFCRNRAVYTVTTTEAGREAHDLGACRPHGRETLRSIAFHGPTNQHGQTFAVRPRTEADRRADRAAYASRAERSRRRLAEIEGRCPDCAASAGPDAAPFALMTDEHLEMHSLQAAIR